jgi:hypothetical protein
MLQLETHILTKTSTQVCSKFLDNGTQNNLTDSSNTNDVLNTFNIQLLWFPLQNVVLENFT